MGLFGFVSKDKYNREVEINKIMSARISQLENLCHRKDAFYKELMSDGLRHRSSLAARQMAERKKYLKGK